MILNTIKSLLSKNLFEANDFFEDAIVAVVEYHDFKAVAKISGTQIFLLTLHLNDFSTKDSLPFQLWGDIALKFKPRITNGQIICIDKYTIKRKSHDRSTYMSGGSITLFSSDDDCVQHFDRYSSSNSTLNNFLSSYRQFKRPYQNSSSLARVKYVKSLQEAIHYSRITIDLHFRCEDLLKSPIVTNSNEAIVHLAILDRYNQSSRLYSPSSLLRELLCPLIDSIRNIHISQLSSSDDVSIRFCDVLVDAIYQGKIT